MPLSGLLLTSQACDLNLNHLKEYFFLRNIFFYIAEKRVEEASNGNSRTGTVMKKKLAKAVERRFARNHAMMKFSA